MKHFGLEVMEREIDGQSVPVLRVTEGHFFRLFRLQEISSLTLEPISPTSEDGEPDQVPEDEDEAT